MYIPISVSGEPFYFEGFVVRFFTSDGSSWVANCRKGNTNLNAVYVYPEDNRTIVIAGGEGYIMNPDETKPLSTFGGNIKFAFNDLTNRVIGFGDWYIAVIDNTGVVWQSERISWDGIKDVSVEGNIISGMSYDPLDDNQEWKPFSINMETKEIIGGSYRIYFP